MSGAGSLAAEYVVGVSDVGLMADASMSGAVDETSTPPGGSGGVAAVSSSTGTVPSGDDAGEEADKGAGVGGAGDGDGVESGVDEDGTRFVGDYKILHTLGESAVSNRVSTPCPKLTVMCSCSAFHRQRSNGQVSRSFPPSAIL